jgi:hypothetical protein
MYLPADQFTDVAAAVPDQRDSLTHGDILLLSPIAGDGSPPLPCLVLDLVATRSGPRLLLAPGQAGIPATRDAPYEIGVRAPSEWASAGLSGPLRFSGRDRILMRATSGAIGRLSGSSFARLNAVRARIHAERDIAAYFRGIPDSD